MIGQDSQKTLAVQYPGYTPTTPPDIDLVGGRLVRFAGGFEVSDTYASEEYDRRNRDSNPLFNSAEFELEKRVKLMDSYIIELKKGIVAETMDGLISIVMTRQMNGQIEGLWAWRWVLETNSVICYFQKLKLVLV